MQQLSLGGSFLGNRMEHGAWSGLKGWDGEYIAKRRTSRKKEPDF